MTNQDKCFDSLEKFYPVLDQLPVMIWGTDSQGNWNYFNDEWLKFAGVTLEQEKGYGWTERVHHADFESMMAHFASTLASQSFFHHKYRMLDSQGKYRILESFAKPIRDSSGGFLGYIGLTYDISQKENDMKGNAASQLKEASAFYTGELSEPDLSHLNLLNDLKQAIEQDEFVLYYQPQYHARTKKIVGLEALVRWNHPKLGLVPPANFIPLAEVTGLIIPLGQKLLQTACRQRKRWQEEGLPPIRLAVNISACQLKHPGFVQVISNTLAETGLESSHLELEITESIAMEKDAAKTLQELKALGVRIALDDFGTGYSSLSCLSVNPIDVIKIDRTFVRQLANKNNKAIISAIIAMACTLGMEVVAEGVETKAQLAFLKRTNCHYLQGYLFSKPLTAREIKKLLVKEKKKLEFNLLGTQKVKGEVL